MFDVAIFAALGWERRAVTGALRAVEPAPGPAWRGRLADGATCVVLQTGIGPSRAGAAAAAAPAAGVFLACGCAGALVDWLAAGDLIAAESVIALDANGRAAERLPAGGTAFVGWASGRGFRVHAGTLVASPVVLDTAAAKAALGATGALAVDMESGALAAAARNRGIPFAGLRVVLDEAGLTLPPELAVMDGASGELRAGRAVAALALRPRLWPTAARLARGQRVAAQGLATIMAALDMEAFAVPAAASAAGA